MDNAGKEFLLFWMISARLCTYYKSYISYFVTSFFLRDLKGAGKGRKVRKFFLVMLGDRKRFRDRNKKIVSIIQSMFFFFFLLSTTFNKLSYIIFWGFALCKKRTLVNKYLIYFLVVFPWNFAIVEIWKRLSDQLL